MDAIDDTDVLFGSRCGDEMHDEVRLLLAAGLRLMVVVPDPFDPAVYPLHPVTAIAVPRPVRLDDFPWPPRDHDVYLSIALVSQVAEVPML